jgi:uncharacterized Zn ribbon protein
MPLNTKNNRYLYKDNPTPVCPWCDYEYKKNTDGYYAYDDDYMSTCPKCKKELRIIARKEIVFSTDIQP